VNAYNGQSWPVTSGLSIRLPVLSAALRGLKSRCFVCFLQNLTLCTEQRFPGGIIWCYSEQSAVPRHLLAALRKNVQIHEGVPENNKNAQGKPCLFILDDLLNEVYSRAICDLFTKGSHHRNLSVILITQNFFTKSRIAAIYRLTRNIWSP